VDSSLLPPAQAFPGSNPLALEAERHAVEVSALRIEHVCELVDAHVGSLHG
jgi:hypothetical protein